MSGKTFTVRRGTTAIPNQTIYARYEALPDKDGEPGPLSIQALGLLLLLLSRPTGKASMGYRAMMGRGMGKVAVLKALKELSTVGHLYRFKRRSPAGSIITDTVLAEVPLTTQEAEEEWLTQVRQLKGFPVDNPGSHRAAEFDASGDATGATVRRFTGARSNGASLSRESAKSSSNTSYLEQDGENHAREELEPSQSGGAVDNDATTTELGEGYAEWLAFKAERATRKAAGLPGRKNEVAPLPALDRSGAVQ